MLIRGQSPRFLLVVLYYQNTIEFAIARQEISQYVGNLFPITARCEERIEIGDSE